MFHSPANEILEIYLVRIGQTPLLTRKQEVKLAKSIEEGNKKIKRIFRKTKLRKKEIVMIRQIFAKAKPVEKELIWAREILTKAKLSDLKIARLQSLEQKNEKSKHSLIKANLRLVVSIATRYTSPAINPSLFDDLIQNGNHGLFRAVKKFEWRRGYKFATYATWWARRFMQYELRRQNRIIGLPEYTLAEISAYRSAQDKLSFVLKRKPTSKEIAREMGLEITELRIIEQFLGGVTALENLVGGSASERTFDDFLEDRRESLFARISGNLHLSDALEGPFKQLLPQEQEILSLLYGLYGKLPHSIKEVAKLLGLTNERVKQGQALAERKLARNEQLSGLL